MKCSRCQTELVDSATFCPNCGATVQQEQPVMFSYLPAGTPPWPTTVPQKLPYVVETTLAAQPTSVSASSEQTNKPKRSVRSVLAIAAVIILIPILGSALTLGNLYLRGDFPARSAARSSQQQSQRQQAAPTTAPTQQARTNQLPEPKSFTKTSNTAVNVSLQYPSDWQVQPGQASDGVVLDIRPPQGISVGFVVVRFNDATSQSIKGPDDLNQGRINAIVNQQGATDMQEVQPANAQPTISGVSWTQREVVYTGSDGSKIHLTTISVRHSKDYYNLAVLAIDDVYNEAMQKYIQHMLDSLQFLT